MMTQREGGGRREASTVIHLYGKRGILRQDSGMHKKTHDKRLIYSWNFVFRNLCFVTYKREDLFNVFDGGDIKEILEIAVKVNEDKLSLNPLLLLSTWKDNTIVMTKLLEMGADPRSKDGEGRTCLHFAANNDSSAAVEILMKEKVWL